MTAAFLKILQSKNGNIKNMVIKKRIFKETAFELKRLGFALDYQEISRKWRNLLITYRKSKSSTKERKNWRFYEVSLKIFIRI